MSYTPAGLRAAPPIAGESRPFHAIVSGVPPEASWFRFAPATARDAPALPTSAATASAPSLAPDRSAVAELGAPDPHPAGS